ncbi:DNA adenine methylase [Herbaspirillum sp. Sphag1AN]|nr:DNA adenine methylase [Herbaspirillum sp. Sphag1AN]MBB3245777.1 DNA adenine methylase [Herbaspirillum sp. Sphag64]
MPFIIELIRENDLFYGEYAEPFAGGAGIAVSLLLDGYVDKIYLNDFDPAIYAFWSAALNHTDALCSKIESTKVDMDEWHKQRTVYFSDDEDVVSKGFATLFLNRTNRSGIIKAGVIGGLAQTGNYKMDCRFIKPELIRKIRRIAGYREQISLTCLDAVDFIKNVLPKTAEKTLVNLDPPYFGKGPELYANFYTAKDHALLAKSVHKISRRWMVTYDDASEIRDLYKKYPMFSSSLNYSAQTKRVGTELMVLDPKLRVPESIRTFKIEEQKIAA